MRTTFALALAFVAGTAAADIKLLVAVEPSDREAMVISAQEIGASLSRAAGVPVRSSKSQDLSDAMRSTRTGEYDVYIAPAHVAASALSHGFALVGSTEPDEVYQLVAKSGVKSPAELKGGRIYLPQQDSVGAYMARGMLNESGQSLKTFRDVLYRRTSGAGLFAIDTGIVDATVAKRGDVEQWQKSGTAKGAAIITSRPVPGGMTVVVKKDMPDAQRAKVDAWFTSSAGMMPGIGRVAYRPDPGTYRYVATLGNWTPAQLPGAKVVTAEEVSALARSGAAIVDVRTAKEYNEKRIPGAISIPYGEKSVKDVAFDPKADDFPLPDEMDRAKPVVFHCNGAECWKSYKASQVALSRGFKTVYWFRGGMPEWEKNAMAVDTSKPAPARLATADPAKR
jgi:rhodanese-related sulfurtransferase/ABC-type phosphate/phosphonate transport system substrate-binding protein